MLSTFSATSGYLQSDWNLVGETRKWVVINVDAFKKDATQDDELWTSYLPKKPDVLAQEILYRAVQGLGKFVGRIQPIPDLPILESSINQLSSFTISRLRRIFVTALIASKVCPAEMADEMRLFFEVARTFSERITAFHKQDIPEELKDVVWKLANPDCQQISDLEDKMLTLQNNILRYATCRKITCHLQIMQKEIVQAWKQKSTPSIDVLNTALKVLEGVLPPLCKSPENLRQMIEGISGSPTGKDLRNAFAQVQILANIYYKPAEVSLKNIKSTRV
jgi:hypothetical protein